MEDTEVNKHSNPLRRVYELVRSRYLFKIGMAVLVVTVLLAGAGYAAYAQTQSEVRADADDKLMDFANLEAQGLDGFIRDHEQKAADLSRRPVFMSGDEGDIRSQLQAVKSISPDYVTEIHYYNTETDTVEVSSEKRIEGKQLDENDRPWAVDTDAFDRTGEARSFEPYEEEGNRELGFASPVLGNEEYLAVVTVDLSARANRLDSPVEGGSVQVVSSRGGTVALANDEERVLEQFFLLNEMPRLEDGVTEQRIDHVNDPDGEVIDDEDVVAATVPMEEKPWAVVVTAPEATAYDAVGDITQSVLLLVGVGLFGLVALGGYVARDVNKSVAQLSGYATEIEAGNLDIEIDDSRTDEFGDIAGLFVQIRDTLDEQLSEIEGRAEEAERAKAEAEALTTHLEAKVKEYRTDIEAAADGDLTRRLDPDGDNESMAEIARALNGMFAELEAIVVEIQAVAEEVAESSTEVTGSTGEVESTSADVAESVEEISAGAETQNQKLEESVSEMSNLSATVEEVASTSNEAAEQAEQAVELGQEGQQTAQEAIEEMERIESKAADTVAEMESLQSEVRRIGEIVELIDEIAGQTNILALNASIEAASTDGGGEGFAVVADEVKELAEETADATQEIETLIETVETSTDSVADDMFEMRDDIQMGRETVDGTVETLESIVTEIRDANDGIQSINVATDEQADSTQEVVAMVEDVASVSEQTAEEAQTVSAAAEEQTSAIEQIASSADSLSERADELRSLVDGFETQAGASAGETDLGEGDAVSADGGPHATDGGPGSDDDTTPDERT